jgi:hypothetical protein
MMSLHMRNKSELGHNKGKDHTMLGRSLMKGKRFTKANEDSSLERSPFVKNKS